MNKKKIINYLQLMQRVFFVYRIALVLLILAALFMPHAGAVDDMWVVANRIIKDVYTKIAGVSTVLCRIDVRCRSHWCKNVWNAAEGRPSVGLAQACMARMDHYKRYRRIYCLYSAVVYRSGNSRVVI